MFGCEKTVTFTKLLINFVYLACVRCVCVKTVLIKSIKFHPPPLMMLGGGYNFTCKLCLLRQLPSPRSFLLPLLPRKKSRGQLFLPQLSEPKSCFIIMLFCSLSLQQPRRFCIATPCRRWRFRCDWPSKQPTKGCLRKQPTKGCLCKQPTKGCLRFHATLTVVCSDLNPSIGQR